MARSRTSGDQEDCNTWITRRKEYLGGGGLGGLGGGLGGGGLGGGGLHNHASTMTF